MTQWGVDAIFNPSKRHMDEEKRRLQSTRQEIGDNSGGRRIDLLSGKVRIQRRDTADETEEVAGTDSAEDAAQDDADEAEGAGTESSDKPAS